MDLYRYFHPHHNPRLRNTPLRLQELGELEQAASELSKALKRAEIRTRNSPVGPLREEHFAELLTAANYLVESLSMMTKAHPGDSNDSMAQLLRERKDAPGWENWSRLLRQRLNLLKMYQDTEEETSLPRSSPARAAASGASGSFSAGSSGLKTGSRPARSSSGAGGIQK